MYSKKLSAEESLHEILLRMNYDSRKTLSENSKVLEQSVVGAPNFGMINYNSSKDSSPVKSGPIAAGTGAAVASEEVPNNPSESNPQPQDSTKQVSNPTPPSDLKDVKHFQDWLDNNVSSIVPSIANNEWAWSPRLKKYYKVEKNPNRGYGRYGPSTQKMWNDKNVKEAYLKSLQGGGSSSSTDTASKSTDTATTSGDNIPSYSDWSKVYNDKLNPTPDTSALSDENKPVVQVLSPDEWLEQ